MIATTTILQRLVCTATFGWLLVDASSVQPNQQQQRDELPKALYQRTLQYGAQEPGCCQWICPPETPSYYGGTTDVSKSDKDKYDKGSKHSSKDKKDKGYYKKDEGYWRHLMTQKQGSYPPVVFQSPNTFKYNEYGCYEDCSACYGHPYMPPPQPYGPPPGYYGPPPGYWPFYPPQGGWYSGHPGGPYPPPHGSSDEGYYYYNSMKKSGKKMGYKSGGKMMGSSSVKMGSMMSGKGKIPSSYWPDPVHDYHSDDSDDVCCLEWRAKCSYVDSPSRKMIRSHKGKGGREEICVPYCAVPCDGDDYDLPSSGCIDLSTFVNPSGCDCQCTCCNDGDPDPDDDYHSYDYNNYYAKNSTSKKSKKHRHLDKSDKMSYPSGGMKYTAKSTPAQQCQCRCKCPEYPYPPPYHPEYPKGSKKDKDGYYPKDGNEKDKGGYYPKDDSKKDNYGYYPKDDSKKEKDGYYPKDDSKKDKDGYYPEDDSKKEKEGYYPEDDSKKEKDGYYHKDDSNKEKDGYYHKDDSKHKTSSYRYSVDDDKEKSKKPPKVEKRGAKMKYPKYPLAKDHARKL